jgi:hypothetical protein
VTTWGQGTFRVRRTASKTEEVTQDMGGMNIFDPATHTVREGGVRRMPVSEFRQRISDAVERLRIRGEAQ